MRETAPFLGAGAVSGPEEGISHKLRMCQKPRLSWVPPGIWGVWDKEVWASSLTGPAGYGTAGLIMGACGSSHPCPTREIPPVQSLRLAMWAPAPGTELSGELGGSSRKGKAAAPVAHGTALQSLKSGSLGAVIR